MRIIINMVKNMNKIKKIIILSSIFSLYACNQVSKEDTSTNSNISIESSNLSESNSSSDVTTLPSEEKIYKDTLIDIDYNLVKSSRFIIDFNTAMTIVDASESYSYAEVNVKPNERYVISFATQASSTCGVLFIDDYGYAINQLFKGTNKYQEFNLYQITIPVNVSKMYVNSRLPKQIEIKKCMQVETTLNQTSQLPKLLRFGSVNCGQFQYTDGIITENEYLNEWKRMIKNNPYDLFAFEDVSESMTSSVSSKEILNSEGYSYSYIDGFSNNLKISSVVSPESIMIVPFQNYIDGSTKITKRYYALRVTFHIGNKHTAIYALHLVAEGHISSNKVNGELSLSQKLRQIQFSQLIDDGNNYDIAIFAGDFNAQVKEEYDVFTKNNYILSNCGEFGVYHTLRDIPVDNVIVSSNVIINKFAVLDTYNLNTDHTPVFAELIIK